MHGLGESGDNYLDLFDQHLKDAYPEGVKVRIVLPTAPKSAVTSNFGIHFNSWFNVKNEHVSICNTMSEIMDLYDQDDMEKSADQLLRLIYDEVKKLPDRNSRRIFIGGFGEGCMVALAALIKNNLEFPIGGLIGLSGVLAFRNQNRKQTN